MNKNFIGMLVVVASAAALTAGCATSSPGALGSENVGDFPKGLSPQYVKTPPAFTQLEWWNRGSFQAVPEDKLAAGQEVCNKDSPDKTEFKVTGYHPYARGSDGYPIKGGGFYCEKAQ
jgi:hypothetical protein